MEYPVLLVLSSMYERAHLLIQAVMSVESRTIFVLAKTSIPCMRLEAPLIPNPEIERICGTGLGTKETNAKCLKSSRSRGFNCTATRWLFHEDGKRLAPQMNPCTIQILVFSGSKT